MGVCIIRMRVLGRPRTKYLTETNTPISRILPPTTAAIHPGGVGEQFAFLTSPRVTAIILGLLVIMALGFRMNDLGVESFSEDELNKLQTIEDYRANGLSGKNG